VHNAALIFYMLDKHSFLRTYLTYVSLYKCMPETNEQFILEGLLANVKLKWRTDFKTKAISAN